MFRTTVFLALLMADLAQAAPSMVYGIDDHSLYTIDTETGAATLVGALDPLPNGLLGGLEWANGVLYGLAGTPGNALWRVDPETAQCTLVGTLNTGGYIFEGGLAWDGEFMWGVNHGYGMGIKELVRIDLSTGVGTVVGAMGDYDFNGLAVHGGELYGINDRIGIYQTDALWIIDRDNPSASYPVGGRFDFDLGVKGGMAGEFCYADGPRNGSGPYQFFRVNFTTGEATVIAQSSVRFRSLASASPYSLDVGELVGGEWAEAVISGATPSTMQYIAFSLRGPGSTYVPALDVTLDLESPKLATQGLSDTSGHAVLGGQLPSAASGRAVWIQGCEIGRTTNTASRTIE